ncbi:DNA replication protein DnaC [Bradyrhizobium sp. USDA 3686]|nr:DNA replication protein DnaC [Bradyrhizobium canariense]
MVSKAQVTRLAAENGWLGKGANLLLFVSRGGGKSHLAPAISLALIEHDGASSSPAPPTSSRGTRLASYSPSTR